MRKQLLLMLPLLALQISCSYSKSEFYVKNDSGGVVHDVTVSDRKQTWKLGDIPAGESVEFVGHLSGEGGPSISWTANGKRFTDTGCYYTGGAPARGSVLIVGSKLKFNCQ